MSKRFTRTVRVTYIHLYTYDRRPFSITRGLPSVLQVLTRISGNWKSPLCCLTVFYHYIQENYETESKLSNLKICTDFYFWKLLTWIWLHIVHAFFPTRPTVYRWTTFWKIYWVVSRLWMYVREMDTAFKMANKKASMSLVVKRQRVGGFCVVTTETDL